jgi:dsRNA-specific ribonuclease
MQRSAIQKDPTPRLGIRGDAFKTFIKKLLTDCKIKGKYIKLLTDDSSIPMYESAFTHKSIDPISNYERFEILGDITCNKFLVWYFSRRFPKLFSTQGVKIIAELRIKYGSKIIFSPLALELGFMPYISAIQGEFDISETSLREDVFEAFIGTTEYILDMRSHEIVSKKSSKQPADTLLVGVGYSICYEILKVVFDSKEIDISYQGLHSPVSRLKEIFDRRDVQEKFGCSHTDKQRVRYETVQDPVTNQYMTTVIVSSWKEVLANAHGASKVSAENMGAVNALSYLRHRFNITDDEKATAYNLV